MTVVRRTPYRNTVQNSQLRRKVTSLVVLLHGFIVCHQEGPALTMNFLP